MDARRQFHPANVLNAMPDAPAELPQATAGGMAGMNCRARAPSVMPRHAHERGVLELHAHPQLASIARRLSESHATALPRLPAALTRRRVGEVMESLLDLLFPGLYSELHVARNLEATRAALASIRATLAACIEAAVSIEATALIQLERFDAKRIALDFLADLPDIQRSLIDDAQAAYEGDPAARSLCEVVLAYPGFLAIAAHRLAHRLHALRVPLVPRLMSEWAHSLTGIDIHPGATFGRRAFIDHGTGVVVGETAVIGHNVKLYHGVTLGAASTRDKRAVKRHPTIQDDVTLYANATVLGGATVVGKQSVIGASVLVATTVPEQRAVTADRNNRVKARDRWPATPVCDQRNAQDEGPTP